MKKNFEEIKTQAEQQQYDAVLRELKQINMQKLTKEEQDAVDAIFSILPQETVCSSVEVCYGAVLLKIQRGEMPQAHRWYNILLGLRDSVKNSTPERLILENRISCAGLCLTLGPNTNLLLSFAVLANEFCAAKLPLAKLSATGKFPSVLRGARDLSNLAKHYRASASIVRPLLPVFLEDGGNGVCEAAIAEILYEQNDLNGASLQAAAAINSESPEIKFAALSILARLGAVDTGAKPPENILTHIGDMLKKEDASWLMPNYGALCARFDILRGDTEKVRGWIAECGLNDLDNFVLRDFYMLLTKAKAYIALGEYQNAATLLESLTIAIKKENRVLDTAECLINGAIACELLGSGDLALGKLEEALFMAQEYAYVRVFADCGKQLFHLLARYTKETGTPEGLSEKYIKKITEAAMIFSTTHPALYDTKSPGKNGEAESGELTQSEVHVLQLLDKGKTNKDIAQELHISNSTVKFHISNIFSKLEVSNRVEAIKNAQERGILS